MPSERFSRRFGWLLLSAVITAGIGTTFAIFHSGITKQQYELTTFMGYSWLSAEPGRPTMSVSVTNTGDLPVNNLRLVFTQQFGSSGIPVADLKLHSNGSCSGPKLREWLDDVPYLYQEATFSCRQINPGERFRYDVRYELDPPPDPAYRYMVEKGVHILAKGDGYTLNEFLLPPSLR